MHGHCLHPGDRRKNSARRPATAGRQIDPNPLRERAFDAAALLRDRTRLRRRRGSPERASAAARWPASFSNTAGSCLVDWALAALDDVDDALRRRAGGRVAGWARPRDSDPWFPSHRWSLGPRARARLRGKSWFVLRCARGPVGGHAGGRVFRSELEGLDEAETPRSWDRVRPDPGEPMVMFAAGRNSPKDFSVPSPVRRWPSVEGEEHPLRQWDPCTAPQGRAM